MFSAIVLVCSGLINERSCFTMKNEVFFNSYTECNDTVKSVIQSRGFVFVDKNGTMYDAVGHECINWKGKKI